MPPQNGMRPTSIRQRWVHERATASAIAVSAAGRPRSGESGRSASEVRLASPALPQPGLNRATDRFRAGTFKVYPQRTYPRQRACTALGRGDLQDLKRVVCHLIIAKLDELDCLAFGIYPFDLTVHKPHDKAVALLQHNHLDGVIVV